MSEWQPISTAPRYDYFLGWSEVEDYQVLIFDDQGYFRNDDFVIYHPTHWMPLPAPPAQPERVEG